jgi:hypothetical protein
MLRQRSANAGRISFQNAARARSQLYQRETLKQEELGSNDTASLSSRDIHMLGLGLYWGEGYKRGSRELGFTNSDPLIARFFIRWLELMYGAKK